VKDHKHKAPDHKQAAVQSRTESTVLTDEQGSLAAFAAVFHGAGKWMCLTLLLAIIFVYAPVRQFELVSWDDPQYISENPHITSGLTLQEISWAFTTNHAGYWMPVIWLSYMVDIELHGRNPSGLHVTNLLFHIANSFLLFAFIFHVTGALNRSAFVAALFALHPLHVESVAWVTERKDVLSTFFWILSAWAYIAWIQRPNRRKYAWIMLLFALGLMSKPMLVTLPVSFLLLDIWPLHRVPANLGSMERVAWLRLIREKLPLFAVAMVFSVITFVAQRQSGAVSDLNALPFSGRVANALVSYVGYLGKMFWPSRLAAFYPLHSIPVWQVVGAIAILALITMFVISEVRRRPYLLVGWLWYLFTLLPVIGFVQAGRQAMADRFTYVPSIGIFILVAWGIPDLVAQWKGRRIPLAVPAMVILGLCAITANAQVEHWRNSTSLWTHVLAVTDNNSVAHNNLARVLFEQGKFDEAVVHYTMALQLSPDNADAHNNMANALLQHGRVDEAISHYVEALRIQPNHAEAHNNLANALVRQGRTSEALGHYSEAIRIDPDYAEARNGEGALLARLSRTSEAMIQYSEALRLDPNSAEAHNNMGAMLLNQGRADEAIVQFMEAVRLAPSKADFHYNLGVVQQKKGQLSDARLQYNTALQLDPGYQQARRALELMATKTGGTTAESR
jgi:protein O-mannosyl-transferase